MSATQHSSVAIDAATAERLLRQMLLIRRFEERTEEQYTRARIGGYCHLAIGEEAANVGAIDPLEPGDYVLASYRDHGTALAVGSEPHRVMAELFGKATGVAGGYGGSMHLLDVERHFLAAGASSAGSCRSPSASRWRSTTRASRTPCSASSARARPTSAPSTSRSTWPRSGTCRSSSRSSTTATAWARPSRWPRPSPSSGSAPRPTACTASGSTATTCWPFARPPTACCARAREERQPALLETTTYRFRGHSVADAGKVYRAPEEVAEAKKHDPIDRFVAQMGIDGETVARLRSEVNAEIDAAIRQAAADPAPDPAGLYDNVYGDPNWREQFSRMERGGPFGEREGTRAWRA